MNDISHLKLAIYARKSSENEDRQIQSIDDQVDRLQQVARERSLTVSKVVTETKSAKEPYKRPEFTNLLRKIEKGEIDGILCWQLNRLSRNPVDGGELQWLLQKEVIQIILTPEREYLPGDNALIFSVETGVANQFILDLKKNTKRGTDSKIAKGLFPGLAPIGYLNTVIERQGENFIKVDEERFPIVRKIWDLMLTGAYSVDQILIIANNEYGLRTRKTRHKGGKQLSRGTLYKMLSNVFYTGLFLYKGETYEGKHQAMITLEEFDRVQALLGKNGRPRPKSHQHTYIGWAICGECGYAITAEKKPKFIKSLGVTRFYTYYHCTRKRRDYLCSQHTTYTPEKKLWEMIDKEIASLTILPEFRDWAIDVLKENHHNEIRQRELIYQTQLKNLQSAQNKLDSLLDYLTEGIVTRDEYTEKKKKYQDEVIQLRSKVKETEVRADKWLETAEKVFDFAVYARHHFEHGTMEKKREILFALGKNPILKDGNVTFDLCPWLQPISAGYKTIEEQYLRIEPSERIDYSKKNSSIELIKTQWGA